jgi:hypothetical protein
MMGVFGLVAALAFAAMAHGVFWLMLNSTVLVAEYRDAERDGRILVDESFLGQAVGQTRDRDRAIQSEAFRRQLALGGESSEYETLLRKRLDAQGRDGFVTRRLYSGLGALASITGAGPLGVDVALAILLLWFLVMAFQGEGLELDVQRRRHPMWEWLFSHPIPPGAGFLAEMLTPLASNPIFIAAPIFWGLSLAAIHGMVPGWTAGVIIGAAMAVAASCFSKAIEIVVMLRLPPRSRSAVIGILSWVGYSALMLGFFATSNKGMLVALVGAIDHVTGFVPAAPVRWVFGVTASGARSVALAVATCLTISFAATAASVWVSARATDVGIAGGFADLSDAPRRWNTRRPVFVHDPLLRKKLLWFRRDRGAVVQAVLIPVTMGAFQAFNLRSLAAQAEGSWNWLCGLAVLSGTYLRCWPSGRDP